MSTPFRGIAFVVAFLALASYAFVTLRGPHGIPALFERQRQIEAVESRNDSLVKTIERKRDRIRRLRDNPAEQELEIRRRLKLVGPGETIYIIGNPDKK
jgi:cell division protein FtsB